MARPMSMVSIWVVDLIFFLLQVSLLSLVIYFSTQVTLISCYSVTSPSTIVSHVCI